MPYGSVKFRCLSRRDVPTRLHVVVHVTKIQGSHPPARVMLKPKQLSPVSPKPRPSPIPAPEVMVETSSDPTQVAQSKVRRSPRPHSCRSLCFLDVCCRNRSGQARTQAWLNCCGTAKVNPEVEEISSTFALQSLPEGSSQNGQPGSSCGQRDGETRLGAMR